MPESSIDFFFEETEPFEILSSATNEWLKQLSDSFGYSISTLSYIFCSDEYLLEINKSYLNHDYYTDIITFDNSEEAKVIEGDLFISIDRIRDNAQELCVDPQLELRRVMAHGLLHLMGLKDKTPEQITEMRKSEDASLSLWEKIREV